MFLRPAQTFSANSFCSCSTAARNFSPPARICTACLPVWFSHLHSPQPSSLQNKYLLPETYCLRSLHLGLQKSDCTMTSLSNDFMTSDVDTSSRSGDVLAKIQGFISLQLLKSSFTKHWVFGCFCIWVYSLLPQINGRTPKRDRLDRDRKQLYVGCTNGLPEGDTVTQLLTHTHTVSTLF